MVGSIRRLQTISILVLAFDNVTSTANDSLISGVFASSCCRMYRSITVENVCTVIIRRRFGRGLCEREGKCEKEPSRNGGAEPSQRITQFRCFARTWCAWTSNVRGSQKLMSGRNIVQQFCDSFRGRVQCARMVGAD